MIHFAAVLLISVAASLALTPFVMRLAHLIGAIDHPNERKIHTQPIPRLGGVAIYISFHLALLFIFLFHPTRFSMDWITSKQNIMLLVALLLVLLLGIWDDLKALKPGKKFFIQIIAVTIVYFAGFRISSITNPFGAGETLNLGIFDYPATLIWVVGISNAFNLIDGLDGLASGVAIIASLTISTLAYFNGDMATAFLAVILAGSLLGFLWYNFNPARIFLGDSGSLFVGFTLAIVSIQSSTKSSTAFAILVPILSLGFPIMDTLLAMTRRFLGSLVPTNLKTTSFLHKLHIMFLPDRKHIHHQLIARGLSHRHAVLLLYGVSCVFGLGAFAVTLSNNIEASLIMIAVAVVTIAGIRKLNYREMAILRNGIFLPMYRWPVINRSIFQVFLDLGFSGIAFTLAFYLKNFGSLVHSMDSHTASSMIIACGLQIATFSLFGLHRGIIKYLGIGDLIKIVKNVAIGVGISAVVLALLPQPWNFNDITFFIVDFYLLLTFVAGYRVSFHVLNFFFRRESSGGKGLLIYGANVEGVLTLQHILHDDNKEFMPLGFLDDAPHLERKWVNGYPVFGGHWKLPQLIRKMKIDHILISDNSIRPEAIRRLNGHAKKFGITVRRTQITMEAMPSGIHNHPEPENPTIESREVDAIPGLSGTVLGSETI